MNGMQVNRIQINAQLGSLNVQLEASFADELIIVSGQNGAGKTTLLRCLAGLQPVQGLLQLANEIWLDSSVGFTLPAQQRQLGCVWPDAALLPWLSVEKNIVLGTDDAVDAQWLAHLAAQCEITSLMQRKPQMLSNGEMQRVALARAMYRKPAVLLLDEPFSAQAPAIRQRLRMYLKSMQLEWAIPVIMVSHDGEDAQVLADQHWHMRQGKLLSSLPYHGQENNNSEQSI